MTPEISNIVPGLFVKADKYIGFADGNFITAKKTGEAQIKIHNDNGKLLIATLYNLLFTPDMCNQ